MKALYLILDRFMKRILTFISFAVCVAGWVIAKGFWQTFFAVIFPPYAWYIVVEYLLKLYKIIQ